MNASADITLHLRLVAGDPTAPDECIVRWLPELARRLSAHFREVAARDEHIILTAAHDALMDYTSHPHKYAPQRASLRYYLFDAAQKDLINALRRDKTQGRGAISIHLVEQWLS